MKANQRQIGPGQMNVASRYLSVSLAVLNVTLVGCGSRVLTDPAASRRLAINEAYRTCRDRNSVFADRQEFDAIVSILEASRDSNVAKLEAIRLAAACTDPSVPDQQAVDCVVCMVEMVDAIWP